MKQNLAKNSEMLSEKSIYRGLVTYGDTGFRKNKISRKKNQD